LNKKRVALYALVLIGILLAAYASSKYEQQQIHNWAAENNYKVISVEMTFMDYGPFWYKDEDDKIYKAVLIDKSTEKKRVSYFRIGTFRFEQAWPK